ncbi:hypothetical protein ACFX13_013795 [Malus domestica]
MRNNQKHYSQYISPPPLVLPESDRDTEDNNNIGFGFPSFLFGGSMELMAVPKRKTSPHKRGIRNGPKALKPVPVIVRCSFVRDIRDPEHPYSLEQLNVLSEESIIVDDKLGRILITFTPTIQHCSMATVIGLCPRVKLKHCFPPHYKVRQFAMACDRVKLAHFYCCSGRENAGERDGSRS